MTTTEAPAPSAPAAPKGRFISLRVRLLIQFTIAFTLLFIIVSVLLNNIVYGLAMDRLDQELQSSAETAASQLDGDALEDLIKNTPPTASDTLDDPTYNDMVQRIQDFEDANPNAEIYVYAPSDKPDEVLFLATSFDDTDFKEAYDLGDNTANYIDGFKQTVLMDNLYTDQYGTWVTAVTPINNSAGKPVAALGVDYEASFVNQVRGQAQRQLIYVLLGLYAAGFVIVFILSTLAARPFKTLTAAAHNIAKGEYKQDLSKFYSGPFRSEISQLAEAIEASGRAHLREQALIQEVHELKIQIDDHEKAKQVKQVTESAGFQDLKARAKAMREAKFEDDAGNP
jgi:hypothetical protein